MGDEGGGDIQKVGGRKEGGIGCFWGGEEGVVWIG